MPKYEVIIHSERKNANYFIFWMSRGLRGRFHLITPIRFYLN